MADNPSPTPTVEAATFQTGVREWMSQCFRPEISEDRLERGDRFLEEVLELLQSGGYPRERIAALGSYVYNRPIGEPAQEVGGVMVTLAAYCNTFNLDMKAAGETELARIMQPEIMAKIRAKQAAKPTGSALPVAMPPPKTAREKWLECLCKECDCGLFPNRMASHPHKPDEGRAND